MNRTLPRAGKTAALPRVLACLSILIFGVVCHAASVVYEYDELGRLKRAVYDDGTQTHYQLDATGNRKSSGMPVGGNPSVRLSAPAYSAGEAVGQRTITVFALRSGSLVGAMSVQYTITAGTATAGSDYTASNGTLSWGDGDAGNKSFTITVQDDALIESNETLTVTLGAPVAATVGVPNSAVVTIVSDDNPPAGSVQLSASSYSGGEASGLRTITIIATRTGGSFGAASLPYTITAGTATAGSDYTATNGAFSWADGNAASQTITITVVDDSAAESSETLTVSLGTPSGAGAGSPSSATVTIADDDTVLPTIIFGDREILRSIGSGNVASFQLLMSGDLFASTLTNDNRVDVADWMSPKDVAASSLFQATVIQSNCTGPAAGTTVNLSTNPVWSKAVPNQPSVCGMRLEIRDVATLTLRAAGTIVLRAQ